MKGIGIIGGIISIMLLLPISQDLNAQNNRIESPIPISDNINEFSIEMFKQVVNSSSNTNICISPLSMTYALGMTLNGAAGETMDSMKQVLKFGGLSIEEINDNYKDIMSKLNNSESDIMLEIANSIWIRSGINILDAFIKLCMHNFDSEIETIDFESPEAVNRINGWVSQKTHGKIENVVAPPIPENAAMYLIDAIYFKGDWKEKFEANITYKDTFFLASDSFKMCDMMEKDSKYGVLIRSDFQAVNLPYKGDNFNMAVFLPTDNLPLDSFISELTIEKWMEYRYRFFMNPAILYMPKYKFRYDLSLNEILKTMGMAIAFDSLRADFRNLSIKDTLYISKVIQKAFVQVDEEGTEAAAVTSVELGGYLTSVNSEPEKLIIKLNRPFIFVIHERQTGAILFMGKIVEPVWED